MLCCGINVYLAVIHSYMDPYVHAWNDVRSYIDSHCANGKIKLLGYFNTKAGWTSTPQTFGHRDLYVAVVPFAEIHLRLSNVCAVSIGKGVS